MARNHGLHIERGSKKKPLSPLDLLLVLRVVHLKQSQLLAVVCHCFCKEESYSEEMEPSILFQEWGWILRVYIQFVESIYIYIYAMFLFGGQIWPLNLWGRPRNSGRVSFMFWHNWRCLLVGFGRASRLDFLDFGGDRGIIRNYMGKCSTISTFGIVSCGHKESMKGLRFFCVVQGKSL